MSDQITNDIAEIKQTLNNHMHDYSTKFGRLKAAFEIQIRVSDARHEALKDKIDSYKWGLILVATFTVISLGGFVALAIWALGTMFGMWGPPPT